MTVTDRTDATEQEFRDRIAAFEAAPTPPEVREAAGLEEVARAMFERPLGYGDRCAWREASEGIRDSFRADAAAAVAAYRATQDGGAEVARLSPDGQDVAICRARDIWHVSNGGHYRDAHVADWTPLAPQALR